MTKQEQRESILFSMQLIALQTTAARDAFTKAPDESETERRWERNLATLRRWVDTANAKLYALQNPSRARQTL